MDLIKELGPSGSDNDDEEDGLIIIPPQINTPDSPSVGKILNRGSSSLSEFKESTRSSLFRKTVKNKLKVYTEGRVSLPGSPIPSKGKKEELKLTKEEESIEGNVKLLDNSAAVKGESPTVSGVKTENADTLGQKDSSFRSSVDIELIQDNKSDENKKSVPRTSSIERTENKTRKIKSYPKSWLEIKQKVIDLTALRNYANTTVNPNQRGTFDFRQQLLFKSPANLLNGLTFKGTENKPNQRVAPQFLRFTITQPEISWSWNPIVNPCLNRTEILGYIPPDQRNALSKLMEMKEPIKSSDKKTYNKWYTKIPLLTCETENSNNEPLRLSFMNSNSDSEIREDELTPKLHQISSNIVEENVLVKSGKKLKKKRSRSITEDEEWGKKNRTKKHKKGKKPKHSNPSEISKTKKPKFDKLLEEYSEIPTESKNRKKKNKEKYLESPIEKEKVKKQKVYVDIVPVNYLEGVEAKDSREAKKYKRRSKSSEFLEYNEKPTKRSKDHNKILERIEEMGDIDKYHEYSFKKSRSKSHEDSHRRGSSKSKPSEAELLEESHTPRTEEYHSRWESDEELLKLERHAKKKYKQHKSSSKNMSWESDEENPARPKYSGHHHRSAVAEKSLDIPLEIPLELPLNIMHISRHHTSPRYDERRHRQEQTFYSEDSWERGEYLKIKNELDNIELQKGRQTLSEERRQLEIEKRKVAEMEQRLAEQRYKQQQEVLVVKEERLAESKEKRYFENIGKEEKQEDNFVCEYHKSIIDYKQRKSRWDTAKEDSDQSVSIHTAENYSPPPRTVSSSPFPFYKSPIAIDVDNYSPKGKSSSKEPSVPVEVKEEPIATELLEDIQLPTSTSGSLQPELNQDKEKVVELESEYEQFMMSLENANDNEDLREVVARNIKVKVDKVLETVVKPKMTKSASSSSSESNSASSSGSSGSTNSRSSSSLEKVRKGNKKELAVKSVPSQDKPHVIETITISPEKPLLHNKSLSPTTNAIKPSIINPKATPNNRPQVSRPRVPIKILETIIIEDDEVPFSAKFAKLPEIDVSKIELPPRINAVMDVQLSLIELPPSTIEADIVPENTPQEPPEHNARDPDNIAPVTENIPQEPKNIFIETFTVIGPPLQPPEEILKVSESNPPVDLAEVRTILSDAPKEDAGVKRNHLISIKFLSPKKRALEMNTSITDQASDDEGEKKEREDSAANPKRLFSNLNEPPSPQRTIKSVDTVQNRPQLITAEEKAKLDQIRKETLDRNEKWQQEQRHKDKLMKDVEESLTSKAVIDTKTVDLQKDRDKERDRPFSSASCDRQRKDSTSSDRKKYVDSSKRRPSSRDRDSAVKRWSVSPSSKRRRVSPPSRSDREKDRDRDRDRERQKRSPPRRGDKERDRRSVGNGRRSRSRSPVKSKTGERRRSRDKSPRRRSGEKERDRRDGRRTSPSRSRRRSPSPSSKRRSGHRERSRSTDKGKKEGIVETLKRLAGIDQYTTSTSTHHHSATSTSTHHHSSATPTISNPSNKSPRSSPLDGFKRSLADSTISDDQLLPIISESPLKQSPKTEYYKTSTSAYQGHTYHSKHDTTVKLKLSPKRPSLDDRINQVLGIEKTDVEVEVPRRISTTYEGQYAYGNNKYQVYQHPDYRMGYGGAAGEMKADDGSRLVQMGNVLQIVPATSNDKVETSRSRKDHPPQPSHSHRQSHGSIPSHYHQPTAQQQILQVGNMLQIVPTILPPVSSANSAAAVAVLAAVAPPPPPPPPPPKEEASVQEKVLSSAEELLRQQHAQRKAEKEVRRQERDRRRKEKERKQREREKKKALKVKTKTEDMIKRALMLETEGNLEDASETAGVADEIDEEVKWSPSNPVLAGALANLTKPVGKSILTSEKLSKLNVTKALELLTDSKKQVTFADGIVPGEGTSPSAGEELTSPPPSGKRALKEKRHFKSLHSKAVRNKLSKKKVKVKVVHSGKKHSSSSTPLSRNLASNPPNPNPTQSSTASPSPSDAELDLLPPPSPPPGSPPPHVFPARVKPSLPNNIHPAVVAPYHYQPYAVPQQQQPPSSQASPQIMYSVAPGQIMGVGGYAPPPPPPPPLPSVGGGSGGGRYGGIPALPPTHQLPHHLALRAGVSHKSRQ